MRIAFGCHSQWWTAVGGTEQFTAELVTHLGGLDDFYTITRPAEQSVAVTSHPDSTVGLTHRYSLGAPVSLNSVGDFSEPLYETYLQVLTDLGPDAVHVQHTMNLGVELIHAASALEVPVVHSFHDYFTACPSYSLLDADDRFCGVPADLSICNSCLTAKFKVGSASLPMIQSWRTKAMEALRQVDLLHFPSEAAQRIVCKAHPYLKDVDSVILPTYFSAQRDQRSPRRADTSTLAILGQTGAHKGAHLVPRVVPELVRNGVRVVFVGSDRTEWALDPAISDRCAFTGHYPRGAAVEQLCESGAHAVLLPSIWPETYMRTLSEAWEAGLPAFVLDHGAQADRVRQHGGGVVLVGNDAGEIASQILETLRSGTATQLRTPTPPSAGWLADRYQAVYERLVERRVRVLPPLADVASDIAGLTDTSLESVSSQLRSEAMADGITVARSWNEWRPGPGEVESFYQATDSYLFDLEVASRLRTRRVWRQRVLSVVLGANLAGSPLLDFGCGNGADACFYAKHGLRTTAFDLPSLHLELAKLRAAKLHLDVTFAEGDADQLEREGYGTVTCFEVLEHVPDPPKVIRQIAAALAPGGLALLTESFALVGDKYPSHLPENLPYVGRLDQLCADAGLAPIGLLCGRINVFRKPQAAEASRLEPVGQAVLA